jgi:chemotaxis protein methyltransferase CheR
MIALTTARAQIPLTDEAYHLLNEYLERHLGLSFPGHRRQTLEHRLQPRLEELQLASFLDYHLMLETRGAAEREHLVRAVTNHETYFFRETAQIEALARIVVPALGETGETLHLLSAGCSSGEEAYTLRFFLCDERAGGTDVTIDGFDIDSERVAMAQRAVYRPRSLRQMQPAQVDRYLDAIAPERYEIRAAYRRSVRFTVGNIVDVRTFDRPGGYHVVFCRNVLIYFSDASLRRAIRAFLDVLRPGGYLFLGHAESIIGMFPELETVRVGSCIAYRKVAR